MSKIVQILGGIRSWADKYLGARFELWVDESNWNLRLGDGIEEGGHTILNRDNSDDRYQARSTELDGLTGFTPQQRGFLVRLGPSDYRLRSFTFESGTFGIQNPAGYAGNPKLTLNAVVTTNHKWTGDHQFTKPIVATGGLKGDVTGDVTGDLTGDSTGTHTGAVIGNAAGDHTGSFTGDVDTSGGTLTLGNGQITLDSLSQAVLDYMSGAGVFPGTVVAFAGAMEDIPTGWYLCDGTHSTPDLRNRFIYGAAVDSDIGDVGGTAEASLGFQTEAAGAHTHGLSIEGHALTVQEMPQHNHANGVVDKNDNLFNHGGTAANPTKGDSIDGNSSNGTREGLTTSVGGGEAHTHGGTAAEAGSHYHEINIDSVDNLPPFLRLAYIMKGFS